MARFIKVINDKGGELINIDNIVSISGEGDSACVITTADRRERWVDNKFEDVVEMFVQGGLTEG